MSFKFFTTRFDNKPEEKYLELKKEFPHMKYVSGVYKDKKGIYILNDLETRQYGEKEELENGDIFFPPNDENIIKIKQSLSKFENEFTDKIPVKLVSGFVLKIFPASCQPKKFLFNKKKKEDTPYNKDLDYGRAAYEAFNKLRDGKIIIGDEIHDGIMRLALINSYKLPIQIWDYLSMICEADTDRIFVSALGMDYDYLMAVELPKSDGPA